MQITEFKNITIDPERQRKFFDMERLQELSTSIQNIGLLHPIVVRHETDMSLHLVAGERRMKAIALLHELNQTFKCDGKEIPVGKIPYLMLADLTPDQIFEAELEENVQRDDLSWQEKAEAIKKLHNLRLQQHGEFSAKNPEGQTKAKTAEEVTGRSTATQVVSENLLLADNLDDEDVAKAKSSKEALKIVKKKKEAEYRNMLADLTEVPESKHELFYCDCREGLALIEDESIHCIVADPPYGVEMQNAGSQVQTKHTYDDSKGSAIELNEIIIKEGYRVLKPDSHMYIFCTIEYAGYLMEYAEKVGFQPWPRPLIWDKGGIGIAPDTNRGPRYSYETIIYLRKGDRYCNALYNSVLAYSPDVHAKTHGAQKPVALYKDLLQRSILPGETILDPTCGSGPIFEAAELLQAVAIGMERDKEFYNMAKLRLATPEDKKE